MKYSFLAVVIPAYKESKNLDILLDRVKASVPGAYVIVVDDSPFPEHELLQRIVRKKRNIKIDLLYRGSKLGRGSAVIAGIKKALRNQEVSMIIEMDADLAHSPEECCLLLAQSGRADMVIGSRYLRGSTIKDCPIHRLIQSKIINFFLHFWLGLKISDYTNGFRLYNRKAASLLTKLKLREKGFIALSEIAYALRQNGCTIAEVPVSFTDRKYGVSNATMKELIASLFGVIRLRFTSYTL